VPNLELLDFYSPSAGFDQPLALLRACHERVRRMVELLVPLQEHVRTHGPDARAAVTAGMIRKYFEQAWPRHLQDEELDILPRIQARLRDRHTVTARNIVETIGIVAEQHEAFWPLWQDVAPALRAIESGAPARFDAAAMQAFVELFRTHLALEEDVLDPAYARLLTAEDLDQIGKSMAARRGISWPAEAAGSDAPA
jgi:pyridoxamine 5'-phosphate oxidase